MFEILLRTHRAPHKGRGVIEIPSRSKGNHRCKLFLNFLALGFNSFTTVSTASCSMGYLFFFHRKATVGWFFRHVPAGLRPKRPYAPVPPDRSTASRRPSVRFLPVLRHFRQDFRTRNPNSPIEFTLAEM